MYNHKLRNLVGKHETTPGTLIAIAPGESEFRIREADWTPNQEHEDDKWATGDHAENDTIPGLTMGETKAKILLAAGSAVNVAPEWSPWVESCGWKKTAYGSTGISWVPHTDNDMKTMTQVGLEYEVGPTPQQRQTGFKGCIGNLNLGSEKRGKPIAFDLSYKGCCLLGSDTDIVTGSRILPVSPGVTQGQKYLATTMSIFGAQHQSEKFSLESGNEISESGDQADITGISHFWISSRKVRLKVQVAMQRVSGFDPNLAWRNGTIGVVVLTFQSTFKLTVPRGQIIESKPVSVGNKMYWDLTFKALRNGSTDATMDPQSVCELLQGAKA